MALYPWKGSLWLGVCTCTGHPMGAGSKADTEMLADVSRGESNEEYVELMAQYIKEHPGKSLYQGSGFKERDVKPTAAMLDAICADTPVVITTMDGHSQWLNTAAMKKFGIDKEAAKEYGTDMVRVDENSEPTGYISEAPVFSVRSQITISKEDGMCLLLKSQEIFFSKGYTAVYDAGVELVDKNCYDFYTAFAKEGKLKLRTYAGSLIDENCEDIKGAVENIAKKQEANSEYFKIIGVKTFSDGVIEAHTGYLLDEYADQPGYHGAQRMTDHKKLTELYTEAANHNMNVNCHSIGDAAVRCNLDAIEEAVKATGKTDMRNALAHLQIVNRDDIQRFADLNVIATVAPLWSPKEVDYFWQELEYVGSERAEGAYPMKSFIDAGATYAFHTDYPVSPTVDIPLSVYTAVKRRTPDQTDESVRKSEEFLTRYQALLGMTKNVAYMWHEEDRLGSLETGKIANMTVYDRDFLKDDIEKVGASNLVCTIVDGDIVYKV